MDISIAVFIIFLMTQAGDFYTTWRVLQLPNRKEANPVVKWVMDRIGVVGALILLKGLIVVVIGAALWFYPDPIVQITVILVSVGYGWVISNNVKLMRR